MTSDAACVGGLQSGGGRLWGFNFPEVQGQRGVLRGGEYGGIGAWEEGGSPSLTFTFSFSRNTFI